jgi:glycosyltransferase involved in cell wall biosynthesis
VTVRVLQLHWTFPPTTGGVESHVADLAVGLHERGCEVAVLTGEPAAQPLAGVEVVHSDVLDLERIRDGLSGERAYPAAVVRDLDRVISSFRPDVVHGHNLHHFASAPALALDRLARQYGIPVHHTFHETWPDMLHDEPVYRGWSGNYAVSRHVRDECAARIGFAPELRPLGIDVTRFRSSRPAFSGDATPVLLHPARLLPWKGVHVSVRMISLLAERGVPARLVVTDTGRIADWDGELADYRADIVELIERFRVGDRVELRAASYHDMPGLYEEADVVVYPTVAAEPYGLVPLEAMSCSRPVVASRCGGIPETVVDGVTGWLVDAEDPGALAARVTELIEAPEGARRLGAAGRRRVVEHFDIDTYVDDLLVAYRVASMAK